MNSTHQTLKDKEQQDCEAAEECHVEITGKMKVK
jgi:hypothetical protein